jgi:hypothetical protein
MKKPYIKSEVKKLEVSADIIRMLTKQGFADLFMDRLGEARRSEPATTHEKVFDEMNTEYFNVFGYTRYSCYDSFRQRMNEGGNAKD